MYRQRYVQQSNEIVCLHNITAMLEPAVRMLRSYTKNGLQKNSVNLGIIHICHCYAHIGPVAMKIVFHKRKRKLDRV
jgi:hypothetical protein